MPTSPPPDFPLSARRIPKASRKGKPDERLLSSLRALRRKYLVLAHLRGERDAAEILGILRFEGDRAAARQHRTRALAGAFPGVLRELEGFDARKFFQRAGEVQAEITAVRHGQARLPRRVWIRLVLDFHASLREVLQFRQGAAVDGGFLRRYLRRPPGSRLMELVWEDLAQRHKMTVPEVRRAVLGEAPWQRLKTNTPQVIVG